MCSLSARILCVLGIMVIGPVSLAKSDAGEIPDIRTLEQLLELEPTRLDSGCDVRLGISDGGLEAGPWRLIYCYAKQADLEEPQEVQYRGRRHGKRLGPVFFRVLSQPMPPTTEMAPQVAELFTLPSEGLYCGLIATAWAGEYHVAVRSQNGDLLGRAAFDIERPTPCYWQEFARQDSNQPGSGCFRVRGDAHAAVVDFAGLSPIWAPGRSVRWARHRDGTPLPGKIPIESPWRELITDEAIALRLGERPPALLRLSLKGEVFHIDSDVKMITQPDLYLLVRWWVNDRLIPAARTDRMEMIQISRALRYENHLKVAFGLPKVLEPLKPGDKVALQVLYCPDSIRTLPKTRRIEYLHRAQRMRDADKPVVPLLSNRIEFPVTRQMVGSRTKHADG